MAPAPCTLDPMPVPLVVFGDFNCPYSCLASARVDRLVDAGIAEVDWRAVEHDTDIPAPSRPAIREVADMFAREVAEVTGLLEPGEAFPITVPPVQPNTRLAIGRFAALEPSERHEVRRALFAALWFDGRDTGQEEIVDGLVPVAPADGAHVAGAWRNEWLGLDRRLVPMLLLPDGVVSRGLGALARLAKLAG
jgi:2-hydroxychromene-2-carboxylate isomerase